MTDRSDRTKFRNQVLKPLLEAGWMEMTIPDKPTSSKQRYRLTIEGKTLLAQLEPRQKGHGRGGPAPEGHNHE